MRERPEGVGDEDVRHALAAWGIGSSVSLEYAPVGFGDYHWIATVPPTQGANAGRKWFVTVADLAAKEYLGTGPDAAYRGLTRAMDTAVHLREHGGLDFVVAPVRAAEGGGTVRRLGARHAVGVLPFVPGAPGHFGQSLTPGARHRVIDLLARLHQAEPPASLPVAPAALPQRAGLEQALDDALGDAPDDRAARRRGGPFGERARALLSAHAGVLRARLAGLDRLTGELHGRRRVVTHGEPHPGNVLTLGDRSLLIDWDTVGLAPPERDLWHVARNQTDLDRYAEATGHRPDRSLLDGYRLRWALDDVAAFAGWFRAPHDGGADSEQAWAGLRDTVAWLASTPA
ncbi:phosphotransferase [Nonomuraea sp. 3-1Str]|uniref:phosphotransferase n=1 Tax=Nonomuraea sp. 3-1Str TaxID=2929801 RepID=UPI0028677464|nr:phosphotransferase [Nonomuraea sp. 3-1Str]MDR8414441.1 phosphotransferase [Nonomuraea sp. 3-1Str]